MHSNTSTKTFSDREIELGDIGEKAFFHIEKGKRNLDRWDPTGDGIANNKITEVKVQFRHIINNCFAIQHVTNPNAKGYNNFQKCTDLTKRLVFVELRMDNDMITFWEVPKQNKTKFFTYYNNKAGYTMAGWKIKDCIKKYEIEHKALSSYMKELSTADKDFLIRNSHKIID